MRARDARPHGPRLSPAQRRGQLLDLGVRLLADRSLDELSIDLLAEEAGISRGLLYHYFGNKTAFHEAVVRHAADDLIAKTAPPPGGEPLERLLASVAAYVDYVVANYEGYVSLVRGAAGGNESLRAIYEEVRDVLDRPDLPRGRPGRADRRHPAQPARRARLVGHVRGAGHRLGTASPGDVTRDELLAIITGALPALVEGDPRARGPGFRRQRPTTAASWSRPQPRSSSLTTSGGSETDRRAVGVLRQDAAGHQGLADLPAGADRGVDVDACPQAAGADADDAVADHRIETRAHDDAEPGGAGLELAGGQHVDDRAADRAGQRVAAEGAAVLAGLEDAEDVAVRHDGRDRDDAAAERLAQDVEVGDDALVVAREGPAGPAEAGLDLVGREQHVVGGAELADPAQVAVRRDHDAALALDGLDEHGDRVRRDGGFERREVAVGHLDEPGRERAEPAAGLRVVGEADDRGRPAVEVAGRDDDLGLVGRDALDVVAPLAGRP